MNSADLTQFKASASQWARDLLARPAHSWVLLDTETTGLGDQAEVVQIGVINGAGKVLVDNRLVKPTLPIDPGAEAIHHISNAMVVDGYSHNRLEIIKLHPSGCDFHVHREPSPESGWNRAIVSILSTPFPLFSCFRAAEN